MQENRTAIRVDIKGACNIEVGGKKGIDALLEDISISGIGVICKEEIERNSKIKVNLIMEEKAVVVEGRIVFTYEADNKYRYGVKFEKIGKEEYDAIDRYVKREIILYLSQSKI